MRTKFKIVRIINIIALLFLLFGAYGLVITGALQLLSAAIFLFLFPKNKLIYVYFGLVAIFFMLWDGHDIDWYFLLPLFLIFFLTFIIYKQKKQTNENA